MTRPTIAPEIAAALTAQIPPRLLKKLDAEPRLAERWAWTASTVTTDKGEVVTLDLADGIVRGVTCSCLLQPRCLHVAAVAAVLEPAEATPTAPVATVPAIPSASTEVHASTSAVAAQAVRVISDVLAGGAETSGAFVQAELLRSIHACRTIGLHRLATTQTRILRSVRELRADKPEFSLAALSADVREALAVAHALAAGEASSALLGTARRDYETIGNVRLRGVFTEAVVARSGYAGAITYLVDDKGVLYTRADIAPGDAGRAAGAYDAPANLGDAVLPHRELCRSGLFLSDATRSADGRLGAGQKVRAVRASEPSLWSHDGLASRWQAPLPEQLARIAAHDATPEDAKPAGWDLVFVEGMLLGGGPGGVGLHTNGTVLRLTTAHDHRVLPARDNLAVLANAAGLHVRAIGRARLGAPRRLELLAIGPAPDETRFAMADAWHGRANLHYDRLSVLALGDAPPLEVSAAPPPVDLLEPLRRRVERVVQGGLGTLPTHAIAELDREAARLAERSLRGGAEVLRDLAAIAHDAGRAMTGSRRAVDRPSFARAWLRAAVYEDTARRRLSVASW
ncbi:MAG: swim zinc finger domain protein [Myxococcales bacterium]|nr:swim zinc finger domain protein [Myxococcales bacterium]